MGSSWRDHGIGSRTAGESAQRVACGRADRGRGGGDPGDHRDGWAVANSPILVDRTADVIWRSLFVSASVPSVRNLLRRPQVRLGRVAKRVVARHHSIFSKLGLGRPST